VLSGEKLQSNKQLFEVPEERGIHWGSGGQGARKHCTSTSSHTSLSAHVISCISITTTYVRCFYNYATYSINNMQLDV